MFTGIIEATAKILEKSDSRLVLERPSMFDDLKLGCSIAVSGACLSVISFDDTSMSFDVVPTTFQKTKFGSLNIGDRVNLERAMRADARLEGHIVTGHIEGVARVALSPNPSPVPGEGDDTQKEHVWKGVAGLTYAPSSVVANARAMRKNSTPAEEKLWQELRGKKLHGYYFRRQRPIGSCIVDFYCEDLRLAIEVDGDVHNEKNQKTYDAWREEHLKCRGVRFLRFSNDEVLHNTERVLVSIVDHINAPLPLEGGGVGGGGMYRGDDTNGSKVGSVILTLELPKTLLSSVVPHGSITIDGVSLTVADVKDSIVSVALIPHTLEKTTLGALVTGETVNIETDILAKYIFSSRYGKQ